MDQLWNILRYVMYFLMGYLAYIIYLAFLKPFLFWMKYKKYKNVYAYPYFIPIFGDLWYHVQDMKNDKAHYDHKKYQAADVNKYDLKVKIDGINCVIQVISCKALEQFVAYQPTKIDNILEHRGITKAVPEGFINAPTTKKTFERRKLFTSLLNMNKASCMVPLWLDRCKEAFDSIKDGEEVKNFGIKMNNIIFNMFISILYGADQMDLVSETRPYTNPDNTVEEVNFCEYLIRTTNSHVLQNFNPCTTLFPYINRYCLMDPYKRDHKNLMILRAWFVKMVENVTDPNCVCSQVINSQDYTHDEMFEDLITIVVAGTETTSRTIVSILYYLKKCPDKLAKLRKEMKEHGFDKNTDWANLNVDRVLGLDYLLCCIKEGLRIDSPVVEVFNYYTYDNIEICGVPIPKNTFIKPDIYSAHYDMEKWLKPHEYQPERHDPDSEFAKKALEDGLRPHTYSRRSFGHGKRACPGQTLAYLKMRVVITYMLSNVEYEVLDGLTTKEGVGFGAGSLIIPRFKINKF